MTDALAVVALVLAALAGLLHVAIFVMESVLWTTPAVRAQFGVATVEDAETTRSLAYNQGFYNLFLAVGAVGGAVVVAAGPDAVGRRHGLRVDGARLAGAADHRTPLPACAATQGTLPALALLAALGHALA